MTLEALLRQGREKLREAGIPDADLDSWLLLEYCFGISRSRYFLVNRNEADGDKAEKYLTMIQKRQEHIPLQHLTHQAWFMGQEYYVDHRVLVPRQDTEILSEEAGAFLKNKEKSIDNNNGNSVRFLDLCTGSGCLLFSLLMQAERAVGIGADLSEDALAVAEINREKLGIQEQRVQLRRSDLFQKIPESFDLIVSNPPYIPTKEIAELSPEVRDHDPFMALDGREDGLWFYREITREARAHLKKDGGLFYEIGWNQGQDVAAIMEEAGFTQIKIKKDYAGLDRVVCGILVERSANNYTE